MAATSATTIEVVDCTDFKQCKREAYKHIPIETAFSFEKPELTFSRYEILRNPVRKVFYDLDGIPDNEEGHALPLQFIEAIEAFIRANTNENFEPFKYVITTNHNSTAHVGFSAHIIVWNHVMNCDNLTRVLVAFKHTAAGEKFAKYVDGCVYSSLRLFKLPNFIGIPMNDKENYHRPDPRDNTLEHYIIQQVEGIHELTPHVNVRPGWIKQDRKTGGISLTHNKFHRELAQIIKELKVPSSDVKETKQRDEDELKNKVRFLLSHPEVRAEDKTRLTTMQNTKPAILEAIIDMVCYINEIDIDTEMKTWKPEQA